MTTILILGAKPKNLNDPQLTEEYASIEAGLRAGLGCCHLEASWEVEFSNLRTLLRESQARFVHYAGHGNEDGELVLQDHRGLSVPARPDHFASLFRPLRDKVVGVYLSACHSAAQAEALSEVVGLCIGVEGLCAAAKGRAMSRAFYEGLVLGDSFAAAFEAAKVAGAHHGGEGVLALYCSGPLAADEILLVDDQTPDRLKGELTTALELLFRSVWDDDVQLRIQIGRMAKGRRRLSELPPATNSWSKFAREAASLLVRQGGLDQAFFSSLRRDIPGCRVHIERIERRWARTKDYFAQTLAPW